MPVPKLHAVKVPWTITSDPALTLLYEDYGRTLVNFRVWFYPNAPDGLGKDDRWITVEFHGFRQARATPGPSEGQAVGPASYDWSEVAYDPDKFREVWAATGYSPLPGIFEVEQGDWLSEEQALNGVRHFIFIGEGSTIEILGKDWTWTLDQDPPSPSKPF